MHPTLLERLKAESLPDVSYEYVDPRDVDVITANPKWTWIARVCHEIPEGKCILLPLPEGYSIGKYQSLLRSNLAQSPTTRHDRFSIRRSKDGESVVVLKAETWESHYRWLEERQ